MIYDLLNSYRKYFENEQVILDSYYLDNGVYLLFKKDGTYKLLEVNKRKSEQQIETNDLYEYFKVRDYYSMYINSNKAVDTSYDEKINGKKYTMTKKICSNNQYTLFFKNKSVEDLSEDKKEAVPINVFEKGIDKYFESLVSIGKKSNKTNMILEEIKDNIQTDEEILKTKDCLKEKFRKTVEIVKNMNLEKDTWIKIFLEENLENYKKASLKYTYFKLFNKNDNNIQKYNDVYGINNYNYGYTNDKKPFMELKTTTFKVGSMVSLTDIKVIRNMYIWLLKNISGKGFVTLPLRYNFTKNGEEFSKINVEGEPVYLLYVINDNGSANVKEFDYIPMYSSKIKPFRCTNYFKKIYIEECEFNSNNIYELENFVSRIWFSNVLQSAYFNLDESKAKIPNWKKNILKEKANIFLEFFHKANKALLKQNLDKIAFDICYNNLLDDVKENKIFNTIKSMNLWIAFDKYFGGDFQMLKDEFIKKAEEIANNNGKIEDDETYFFLIGQVSKYLLIKNKSDSKTQSLLDPIIKASSNEKLVATILNMRDKYSYCLPFQYSKFDNILKQILLYDVKGDIVKNRKYILVGFLEENVFLLKKEDKKEIND